jgi:hypothetical protein
LELLEQTQIEKGVCRAFGEKERLDLRLWLPVDLLDKCQFVGGDVICALVALDRVRISQTAKS